MQHAPVLRSALRLSRRAILPTPVANPNVVASLTSRQSGVAAALSRRGFCQRAEDVKKSEEKAPNEQSAGSGGSSSSASDPPESETKPADKAAEAEQEPKITPMEALEKELAEANEKVAKTKHDLLLALADFENNKKRHISERNQRSRKAMINCATKMVDVFDELETIAKAGNSETVSESCKALNEGIMMTTKVYKSTLEKFDLAELSSSEVGETFVPSRHEQVGFVEADGVLPNTVAEVVRSGWVFEPDSKQTKVIRKVQVKLVTSGPPTPPAPPQ